MRRQLCGAAGYLSIFIVPALLAIGVSLHSPSLAFGVVMLLLPLSRAVFGTVSKPVVWHESIATALERLPLLYAAALTIAIAYVIQHLMLHGFESAAHAVGLGLSLWMTMLLSTCVSHELVHRRNGWHSMIGHCLAGLVGYPVLAQEHLAHHARSGDTEATAWPRVDESVWQFALRRAKRIFADAYGLGSAFWNPRARGRSIQLLRLATAVSVASAALFIGAAGWGGLTLYAFTAVAVWFGVQLINYIQHWGLGDDRLGSKAQHGYGWEDDCLWQAWVTLSISLHNGHHQQSRLPYYRVQLTPDSPRLPAGYVVLMVLCLFPTLWFRLMRPVLEHWESNPGNPRSPGRRLTCFSLYGPPAAPLNR